MSAIYPKILNASKMAIKENDFEGLAILLRKQCLGSAGMKPRIDIETLFNYFDIDCVTDTRVKYPTLAAKEEKGRINVVVFLPNEFDKARSCFALAHMLGHFILEIQVKLAEAKLSSSGFIESEDPVQRFITGHSTLTDSDRKKEEAADSFAASLLMPRAMLQKALPALGTSKKVADFFGVDEQLLIARIEQIEALISQRPSLAIKNKSSKIQKQSIEKT